MMKVVTSAEMRELDRRAIEEYGIPGVVLMENAGIQVVSALSERYRPIQSRRVLVVCGKGNNGGDGLVVARHLHSLEVPVEVFLLASGAELKGDARTNFEIVRKLPIPLTELTSTDAVEATSPRLGEFDLVVDAVFGTGLTSAPQGHASRMIDLLAERGAPVVAVDLPSGLDADRGEIPGAHLEAELTVTFGFPKRAHLLFPAAGAVGDLVVADIGIPEALADSDSLWVHLLGEEDVRPQLRPRLEDSHKGSYGHAVVVAGSTGKGGAAALTALAALRTGAGLVTLVVPRSLNTALEVGAIEVMTLPVEETQEGTFSPDAIERVLEFAAGKSVLALGPGITTHPETLEFVAELLPRIEIPIVVDADGINCLAQSQAILRKIKAPFILTPHPGEMARLTGLSSGQVQSRRLDVVRGYCQEYGAHLALKGAHTVIGEPGGRAYLNPTGNPGMATAGTGDVLTGMIAGFLSQGLEPLSAACCGAFLHGSCGDLAAQEVGAQGFVAGDLLPLIPRVIDRLLRSP